VAVTIPPDTRTAGEGAPAADIDDVADVLNAWGMAGNVQDTAWSGGADPSGLTDSTAAVNAALASGPGAYKVPYGTYLLNGASALLMGIPGTALLCDPGTVFLIGAGFSAPSAIAISATAYVLGRPMIRGASPAVTSNPVASAVEITGAQFCVIDAQFEYVNGYVIESVGGASLANTGCRFINPTAYNCAGGVHVKGVAGSAYGGQQWIVSPHLSQIGAASGGAANRDCILIEDCSDVYVTGSPDCAVSDVSSGSALHVKGLCSSVFVADGYDLGVFPNGSPANSVLLIEDSANGSPAGIRLGRGILQEGLIAGTVSGGASRVYFAGADFANNASHGLVLSGTGSGIYLSGDCTFRGNGGGGAGTNYDLNISGSPSGKVTGARFQSAVTASGTPGVQAAVAVSASGLNVPFEDCDFTGTGVNQATAFTALPTWIRNCRGYNPHGSVIVAVPASGSPVATALHYDSVYFITAGSAGCTITRNTNGFGGGTGPAVIIPAGQTVPVPVRANGTFTPSWTGTAPTWVVDGQ
jgi:hypothetical protein